MAGLEVPGRHPVVQEDARVARGHAGAERAVEALDAGHRVALAVHHAEVGRVGRPRRGRRRPRGRRPLRVDLRRAPGQVVGRQQLGERRARRIADRRPSARDRRTRASWPRPACGRGPRRARPSRRGRSARRCRAPGGAPSPWSSAGPRGPCSRGSRGRSAPGPRARKAARSSAVTSAADLAAPGGEALGPGRPGRTTRPLRRRAARACGRAPAGRSACPRPAARPVAEEHRRAARIGAERLHVLAREVAARARRAVPFARVVDRGVEEGGPRPPAEARVHGAPRRRPSRAPRRRGRPDDGMPGRVALGGGRARRGARPVEDDRLARPADVRRGRTRRRRGPTCRARPPRAWPPPPPPRRRRCRPPGARGGRPGWRAGDWTRRRPAAR